MKISKRAIIRPEISSIRVEINRLRFSFPFPIPRLFPLSPRCQFHAFPQTYADENHGLTNVKEHLYRTLDKFLADCFRPSIPELYFLIKKKKKDVEEIGYL